MPGFNHTIGDITRIVKGKFIQSVNEDTVITDLLTDSRRLVSVEGCLFFALVSKRNDGHKYIEDLYDKGVRNFIVQQEPDNLLLLYEANIVLVKDSLVALQLFAGAHRRQFNIQVIGITGSNGKTIVKYRSQTLSTTGLGAAISQATERGDFHVLAAAVGIMAVTVVGFNRLVWRPLSHRAQTRFTLDT